MSKQAKVGVMISKETGGAYADVKEVIESELDRIRGEGQVVPAVCVGCDHNNVGDDGRCKERVKTLLGSTYDCWHKCEFPVVPAEELDEAKYDEVRRLMDVVVATAVLWRQAGHEGGAWFDQAEALDVAIDALLEYRDPVQAESEQESGNEEKNLGVPGSRSKATSKLRGYYLTGRVHPETVVRWFLDLHHYWFDESLGPNVFTGMRDDAERYLGPWIKTGEFAPDHTLLEINVRMKLEEWLKSSWSTTDPTKPDTASASALSTTLPDALVSETESSSLPDESSVLHEPKSGTQCGNCSRTFASPVTSCECGYFIPESSTSSVFEDAGLPWGTREIRDRLRLHQDAQPDRDDVDYLLSKITRLTNERNQLAVQGGDLFAVCTELAGAAESMLPYLSTEDQLLDYASLNDGRAAGFDTASVKMRKALAAYSQVKGEPL